MAGGVGNANRWKWVVPVVVPVFTAPADAEMNISFAEEWWNIPRSMTRVCGKTFDGVSYFLR